MDPIDFEKVLQTLKDLKALLGTGSEVTKFVMDKFKTINKMLRAIKAADKTDARDERIENIEKVILELMEIMRFHIEHQNKQEAMHSKHLDATLRIIEQMKFIQNKQLEAIQTN